ncbi:hypothetical protein TNCV_4758261 [Trichonephila clavipes]|nr:hypothetical protein TNCV_4758261 [Trichonephila clavipes]
MDFYDPTIKIISIVIVPELVLAFLLYGPDHDRSAAMAPCRIESLMYVKFIEAQDPHVQMVCTFVESGVSPQK